MAVQLFNTLKKQKGWYVSFHIIPMLSYFKHVDTGNKSIHLCWLSLGLGIFWN
jgi:hypothetical protein